MFNVVIAINFLVALWCLLLVWTNLKNWGKTSSEMLAPAIETAAKTSNPRAYAAIHMAVTLPLLFGLPIYGVCMAALTLPKPMLFAYMAIVGIEILFNFDRIHKLYEAFEKLDASDLDMPFHKTRMALGVLSDFSTLAVMVHAIGRLAAPI